MRRARALNDADRAAWAAYARTVATLPGVPLPSPAPPPAASPPPPSQSPPSAVASPRPSRPVALAVGTAPSGLDKASWQRLRTGRVAPSRTLDLHGQTAQRAFHTLHDFLLTAHADRLRCVEVITGRGGIEGGVLRRELPFWLNGPSLRPLVLAVAHPSATNVGSVRVLLRRIREPAVARRLGVG